MKKLLVAMIAMAFIVGLVADMAVAEERLSLSGQVRVRAWSTENYDFTDTVNDEQSYWDQRFRMQAVISPADGVKGVLRFDFAEDKWGSDNWATHRYNEGSELQVDRAYLDVTKGIVNVKAGQQYMGLGNSFAYDNNQTGLQLTIATPVVVRLGYAKIDENADATDAPYTDEEDIGTADVDHYFINIGYKSDVFSIDGFYAMQKDDQLNDEPNLFGALAKFGVGPVSVIAELDVFGGDDGAGTDYTGIQFIADASMAMSDAFTLGVDLIYSDGTNDAGEVKTTRFPNAFFGSMYYSDYGAFATDITPLGDGDVFDPADTGAGAMGGGVYVKFAPMDTLTLYGQLAYLTSDEDFSGGFDSGLVGNLSAEYLLVQNTTLAGGVCYVDADVNDGETDPFLAYVARLQITF
jgi:hypothetical protein